MEEDLDIWNDGGDNMNYMITRNGDGADEISGSVTSERRSSSCDGINDAFSKLKKTVLPIRLTDVVCAEIVRPSHVDIFNVLTDDKSYDKACKSEVGIEERIIGMDDMIGLGGVNDSVDGVKVFMATTARQIWSSMRLFEIMGTLVQWSNNMWSPFVGYSFASFQMQSSNTTLIVAIFLNC